MSKSSASFIAYELRPSKQTERRILLDYLESLKEAGIQVSSARYIGMGGTKFYDFAMVHRYLGITDLISCERNKKVAERADFSRPFARIKVINKSVGEYITKNLKDKLSIAWLDYDDALSEDIIDDIIAVGKDATIGSSVFITVASGLPRDYVEKNENQRLDDIKNQFGSFAADVSLDDVEESNFGVVYYKVIIRALTNAFSGRSQGTWIPYFQIEYKDSTRMLTIGGSFLEKRAHSALRKVIKRRLPFLHIQTSPYKIRSYNITEKERQYFEFSASARTNCKESNKLRELGFSPADIKGYRELVRFMPRYVEVYN